MFIALLFFVCLSLISLLLLYSFLSAIPLPPISTLFPYTTLFRSLSALAGAGLLRATRSGRETRYAVTPEPLQDRKSTRLNSSHLGISYAVFCLKKKKKKKIEKTPQTIKEK